MVYERMLAEALRGAVLLGCALAAMPLLRGASASVRRLVLALALGAVLVLPAASSVAPAWRLNAPVAQRLVRGMALAERPVDVAPGVGSTGGGDLGAPSVQRSAPESRINLATVLAGLWGLGAGLLIARRAAGLLRLRRMVARASVAGDAWSPAIDRACRVVGARAVVRVTEELDSPAVAGVLAPVILVPPASGAWSDDRRYAVLLHELAHVRRHDCLVQVVAQLVCALHWFDPLAWLVARRFRVERELAADDAVLEGGVRPSTYAGDLVAIAMASPLSTRAPAGALAMAERSQLSHRVQAILSAARARARLGGLGRALLVAACAAVAAAVACARPQAVGPDTSARAPSVAAKSSPPAGDGASSIDPRLQAIADEELDRVVTQWQAVAGAILVLDPSTGEILADAGRDHGARGDVAVQKALLTGSTMKAFTLAAALEEGVLTPSDRIDCEHGERKYPNGEVMRDGDSYGVLSVPEMFAVSSNVGVSKVFDRLGGGRLGRWMRAFHFGAAPDVPGASAGSVPAHIEDGTAAGAGAAEGIVATASPLQVAAAYAALANGGEYVPPTLTRRAGAPPRERIVKPETARALVALLEGVVANERGTGKLARVPGTRVAGKTGTVGVQLPTGGEATYASFVGFVPSTSPRFVILVGIEHTREDGDDGYGPTLAAPVFAKVAARALGR